MFKILVVEDDLDLNRAACAFLTQSGYGAVGCPDAACTYDAMYGNTFDLIVSDIMLPGTDGYAFAKIVWSLDENIPILFMTVWDDLASKQRGYRAGIDDYIVKPIDLDELLSCPNRAFTRTQLMDGFWSVESNTAPRAVNVYITKLRDKFSRCGAFEIVTVHGLGYKAVVK